MYWFTETLIQAGHILEAIALVNELHPQLLDNDRYLLFHLQQQHLIELIRGQKVEEALQYAAEHLAERGEEDGGVLQELERTLALLAFEDPATSPFADLLQPAHRQQVTRPVGSDKYLVFNLHQHPSHTAHVQ